MNRQRIQEMWRLTWPQIVLLLAQFVVGITDVWTAGRLGPDTQAAIGMISQMQMLLMALCMAAVSGAVASISQSLGAGKKRRASRYVGLVLGLVLFGAILISVSIAPLHEPFLKLVQTPDNVIPTATLFLIVTLWTLPAHYAMTMSAAIFRAAKSVLRPLYVGLCVCFCNLIGDLGFGLGYWGFPAYGAAGIAWTTFVTVFCGAAVLLFWLWRDKLITADSFPPWRWTRKGAPYLLKVAAPALGTSFLWQTGYLVLFVITAALPYGSVNALAGLTAGMRVEAILFLPAVACNMTVSVLVGHSLGQRNRAEAMRVTIGILWVATLAMSLLGVIIWPFRENLAAFIAPDPAVMMETISYLSYNILSVPFTVASVILAGAFNGAGATLYPMITFSTGVWLVRLPIAWLFGHHLWENADGIYMAMLVSQIFQSSVLLWILFRHNWTRFAMNVTQK